MKQYIVDAFTSKPFSGNPAAVCVMENWPSEESVKKLAMENNLSETAFIVKEPAGYRLRWFTPETEVELCGHATLASSFVILNYYEPDRDTVQFHTLSGVLTIRREGDLFEMDFPTYELREIPVTDAMEKAFGIRPVKAVLGLDLICVFEDEEQVRTMQPDQALLTQIEGRIQNASARGKRRTAFPGVSVQTWALQKIRSAVRHTARLQSTGQRNWEDRRFMLIRRQNEAVIFIAGWKETIAF